MFEDKFDWTTIATFSAILIQIIGFGVAFLIIHYQFKRQREIEDKNFRNSVNIDFYKELISRLNDLSLSQMQVKFMLLLHTIELSANHKSSEIEFDLSVEDNENMRAQHRNILVYYSNFDQKIAHISETMDSYSIIMPYIHLFNKFLSIKVKMIGYRFQDLMCMVEILMCSINYDYSKMNGNDLNNYAKKIGELNSKMDSLSFDMYNIVNWVIDIKTDVQNLLLSDYFGRNAPIRTNDKSGIILTSTDSKMIELIKEAISTSKSSQ